ncbi:MAG: hypothetical protein BWY49_00412 [Candidatus Omnitrophica bacterium ADurb.Bin314]|nr:MAG: hypothetical protein BWY49_00412 [Candidatus Omnitrophica bacterium ADurb.Bin314]
MFDAIGLYIEVPGGADQPGQLPTGHVIDAAKGKPAGPLQVKDRFFNVRPRGVLGQDRADHDLKGRISGPPALMSETVSQPLIDAVEFRGREPRQRR